MIETTGLQPGGVIELRLSGRITGRDYDNVLIPTIEAALEKTEKLRVLWLFDADFESYDLEAAFDDAKVGLRHWNVFERIAVVSDVIWLRQMVRAASLIVSCPVKLFELDESEDARRWLRESLGSIHLAFDAPTQQLTVTLLGKLEPSAYEGVSDQIDGFMAGLDDVRLLLDLREFDGWQGLGALGEHLTLVRDHRRIPKRVALVGDAAWQRLAVNVIGRFVNAETRFFDGSLRDAQAWLTRAG